MLLTAKEKLSISSLNGMPAAKLVAIVTTSWLDCLWSFEDGVVLNVEHRMIET